MVTHVLSFSFRDFCIHHAEYNRQLEYDLEVTRAHSTRQGYSQLYRVPAYVHKLCGGRHDTYFIPCYLPVVLRRISTYRTVLAALLAGLMWSEEGGY